ncbi:MAG: FecR family protein, partial [Bacteroidales bacterium]
EYIWSLIGKVLSGNATAKEEQILHDWRLQSQRNEQIFLSCQKLWDKSANITFNFDAERAWQRTSQRLRTQKSKFAHSPVKYIAYTIAASVLIILATTVFVQLFYQSNITVTTYDKTKQLVLSDGTVVEINRNTKIIYPRKFMRKHREVMLARGEAFFAVKPDSLHPFVVTTPSARVKVLGTRFNVRLQPDGEVMVMVQSGKVSFQGTHLATKLLLTRNEGACYFPKSNSMQKLGLVDWNILAWKTHRLSFRDAELRYVFDILRNTYGKTIQSDSTILANRLTATFDRLSLEEILKIIDRTFLLKSQPVNDTLFIVKHASREDMLQK